MMQAVKVFVILGAVVILMGLGMLFARLQEKTSGAMTATSSPEVLLQEESIPLPTGARVTHLAGLDSSGAALLVELPDGGGQLLFFSAQGKLKRRITLEPAARDRPTAPRIPGS